MLQATKTSFWRGRYDVSVDGHPLTTYDGRTWKSGGDFILDGRRYAVRSTLLGHRYTMTDDRGATVATAQHVGRKQWTVETDRQVYRFRRTSIWTGEQSLLSGDTPVGSIKRTSLWRGDATADLPGLPVPVQLFVLGVMLSMWEAEAATGAA